MTSTKKVSVPQSKKGARFSSRSDGEREGKELDRGLLSGIGKRKEGGRKFHSYLSCFRSEEGLMRRGKKYLCHRQRMENESSSGGEEESEGQREVGPEKSHRKITNAEIRQNGDEKGKEETC